MNWRETCRKRAGKTCNMRAVLYCDPDCVPVTRVWVTDPDPRSWAQWLKELPSSTNPGTHLMDLTLEIQTEM
eukprot:6192538-Pyramimonas_sp.AAC.1